MRHSVAKGTWTALVLLLSACLAGCPANPDIEIEPGRDVTIGGKPPSVLGTGLGARYFGTVTSFTMTRTTGNAAEPILAISLPFGPVQLGITRNANDSVSYGGVGACTGCASDTWPALLKTMPAVTTPNAQFTYTDATGPHTAPLATLRKVTLNIRP